jgi:hypothetical protein
MPGNDCAVVDHSEDPTDDDPTDNTPENQPEIFATPGDDVDADDRDAPGRRAADTDDRTPSSTRDGPDTGPSTP